MDSKWVLLGAGVGLWVLSTGQGDGPPNDEDSLVSTLCRESGDCATLAVRNQQVTYDFIDFGTRVRVTLRGDVMNEGSTHVETATLRVELYGGDGTTVKALRETVGPLSPGAGVMMEKTFEAGTFEMQDVRDNGGARLILEEWS